MSNVLVVGASAKEDRYSNKAMKMLEEYDHNPIPLAPAGGMILGRKVRTRLADVEEAVDTVTLYIGAERQGELLEALIAKPPRRIIFNPGTENPDAYPRLEAAGITVIEACTLVLLRTRQF